MHRMPFVAFTCALLGVAAVVRADVDLSGTWVVEYDTGAGLSVQSAVLIQTGSMLAFDEGGAAMTGTINPASGAFQVEGTSVPPEPPPFRDGAATADGGYFAGQHTFYVPSFPPGGSVPFTFPMRGTRAELVVCGNAVRDPGEECDDGTQNGIDGCCDAACAYVEESQTSPCGGDGLFVATKARLSSNGFVPDRSSLTVNGLLGGAAVASIAAVPAFRVRDGNTYDRTVTDLACTRKGGKLKCQTPDKLAKLTITTSKKGTKLSAKAKRAGILSPLPPLTISFRDDRGVTRTATPATCKAGNGKLTCTP